MECHRDFCSWEKVLASALLQGKILPTRFTNRPRRHVTYRLLQDNRKLRNKVERIAKGRALPASSRDNCLVTNTCDDTKKTASVRHL